MNSANSEKQSERGRRRRRKTKTRRRTGEEERGGEDSAEVNHKTTHRGSGTNHTHDAINDVNINYKFIPKILRNSVETYHPQYKQLSDFGFHFLGQILD